MLTTPGDPVKPPPEAPFVRPVLRNSADRPAWFVVLVVPLTCLVRRKISTNRIGGFVRRVFDFDMDPAHHVRDAAHLPCRAAKSVQTESVASFVVFSTSAWTWFIMFVMPLACLVAPQNQYKHRSVASLVAFSHAASLRSPGR